MKKNRTPYILSLMALSISTLIWRDMFFFSKVFNSPAWAKLLPNEMWAPHILSFTCLTPVVFFSESARAAVTGAVRTTLIAPWLALASYIFQSTDKEIFSTAFNVAFHYVWTIAWNYTPPALLLIFIRYAAATTSKNAR